MTRVEATMRSGSMVTCRSSMASAPSLGLSSGVRGDERRTADVDGVVELRVLRDEVGNESAVDVDLGLGSAQVFQGEARQGRCDAMVPSIRIHVGVGERGASASGLIRQVADDVAIDQCLVEACCLVLAHLDGGW